MALKVKFGGDKVLKDNSKTLWSKLTVGTNDIVLEGSHKDAVKWLYDQNMQVTCTEGFGNFVFIVIRGKAPRLSEAILQSVATSLGITGPLSLLTSMGPTLPEIGGAVIKTAKDILGALGATTDPVDFVDEKIVSKCTSKGVVVHISSSQGCFQNHGDLKHMMVRLPAGLSSRHFAAGLAALQP